MFCVVFVLFVFVVVVLLFCFCFCVVGREERGENIFYIHVYNIIIYYQNLLVCVCVCVYIQTSWSGVQTEERESIFSIQTEDSLQSTVRVSYSPLLTAACHSRVRHHRLFSMPCLMIMWNGCSFVVCCLLLFLFSAPSVKKSVLPVHICSKYEMIFRLNSN